MGLLFEIADKNSKPGNLTIPKFIVKIINLNLFNKLNNIGEGYVELAQRLTGAKGLFLIKVMLIMF